MAYTDTTGLATETTQSAGNTLTGAVTETAPASDTASSGLNGRLQRLAQRLSSILTALGSPFQAGGSIGNTTFASTIADAANVTLGAKADAKSTATDTTAITAMQVLKQISASVQAPPSQAVTNAGTFATQSAITAASGAVASGAIASGAVASGAFASGSIAAGAIAAGATSIADNEDVASADADRGVKMLVVRKATPANTSGTDGDYEFLQMSAGRLWTSSTIDTALPTGTNAIGKLAANSGVIIGDVNITSVVPGVAATSLGKAEDAVHASGDTGVMALAVRRDTPTSLAGTDGDYLPPTTDANGALWVSMATKLDSTNDSVDAYIKAKTSGGATPYKLVSAATTNATNVKASAGQIYMITASNVNAAVRYLKIYNKASAPTVGTDVPVFTFVIPGSTTGGGTNIPIPAQGIALGTGISFALTTEATDAGTTAVALSEIVVNIAYA